MELLATRRVLEKLNKKESVLEIVSLLFKGVFVKVPSTDDFKQSLELLNEKGLKLRA